MSNEVVEFNSFEEVMDKQDDCLSAIKLDKSNIENNYDNVKKTLSNILSLFDKYEYSEDTNSTAKKIKAFLTKMSKLINDTRIKDEKDYMSSFMPYKNNMAELKKMIDEKADDLNNKIKLYEEECRDANIGILKTMFNQINIDDKILFDDVFNEKWANKTAKTQDIIKEMQDKIDMLSKREWETMELKLKLTQEGKDKLKLFLEKNKCDIVVE